jgi:hypothetical protein
VVDTALIVLNIRTIIAGSIAVHVDLNLILANVCNSRIRVQRFDTLVDSIIVPRSAMRPSNAIVGRRSRAYSIWDGIDSGSPDNRSHSFYDAAQNLERPSGGNNARDLHGPFQARTVVPYQDAARVRTQASHPLQHIFNGRVTVVTAGEIAFPRERVPQSGTGQ